MQENWHEVHLTWFSDPCEVPFCCAYSGQPAATEQTNLIRPFHQTVFSTFCTLQSSYPDLLPVNVTTSQWEHAFHTFNTFSVTKNVQETIQIVYGSQEKGFEAQKLSYHPNSI